MPITPTGSRRVYTNWLGMDTVLVSPAILVGRPALW